MVRGCSSGGICCLRQLASCSSDAGVRLYELLTLKNHAAVVSLGGVHAQCVELEMSANICVTSLLLTVALAEPLRMMAYESVSIPSFR